MTLKHAFVSAIADDPVAQAAGEVLPQAHWNADHALDSSDTQVLFNDGGSVGGDLSFTFDAAKQSAALGDPSVTPNANVTFSVGNYEINPASAGLASAAIYAYAYSKPGGNANGLAKMYGLACEAFHDNENAICTDLYGAAFQIANETATTVPDASGFYVFSGINNGGGAITELYGLKVEDQTVGVTNYNCWFGAGLYHYDALTASNWVFTDASKNLVSKTNAQAAALILSANMVITQLTGVIDGGGGAIAANATTVCIPCTYAGTIAAYTIAVDTGTCTVKTWKKATGTAIPTVADNISTAGVAISSGTVVRSTVVTDFTTLAVAANDLIIFTLSAVSGVTKFSFTLELTKTI